MLNTRIGENYNANDVINSNDLRKKIINVDSRFRSNLMDPTTDFTYNLERYYKNLIRLRIASIEIPNMAYVFTRKNNSFIIKAYDINGIIRAVQITIGEGNYTSSELLDAIQEKLDIELRDPYGIFITVSLNVNTAKITFTNNGVAMTPLTGPNPAPTASAKQFSINFTIPTINDPCKDKSRRLILGIGHNLGFRQPIIKATSTTPSPTNPAITTYFITGESCLDVVGDPYMFLCVNDFHTIEQRTDETYIQCLAKIIIREEKQMVIYDDGASLMTNEIIFPSPIDLKVLQVKLIDPYGEVIDLCGMNFSFSLEITEVLNTNLYDFYRNYIWLGTIPTVKRVQGIAQPLLKGAGPPW
jgi:hypothetical protein